MSITTLFSILALVVATQCANSAPQFWAGYPSCSAGACLVPITESSGCELIDNFCVCTNTTFLTLAALCIGANCASDDIYQTYSYDCKAKSLGEWEMEMGQNQWNADIKQGAAQANGTASTSANSNGLASATSTSNADGHQSTASLGTPTNTGDGVSTSQTSTSSSGMSTSDKIAIGIGVPSGVFGLMCAIFAWISCRKDRRTSRPPKPDINASQHSMQNGIAPHSFTSQRPTLPPHSSYSEYSYPSHSPYH